MRLASTLVGLVLLAGLSVGPEARAGYFEFDTESTATQDINSAFGAFTLTATGIQHFTINTTTGYANVTSPFQGSDFPDPYTHGYDTYNLYNTATTGTVTTNGDGSYNVSFSLLFELDVTSGALAGLSVVTHDDATFTASNIATLPFPSGTGFFDPGGSDTLNLYAKDAFGPFAQGQMVGTSSNRLVTINSVVPEPSSIVSAGVAAFVGLAVMRYRRRRQSAA